MAGQDGTVAFATREGTQYREKAVRLSLVAADGRVVLQQRFATRHGESSNDFAAAVDPAGVATFAWARSGPDVLGQSTPPSRVQVVRCRAGACGRVRTMGTSTFFSHPAVSFDRAGRSVVLWRGNRGSRPVMKWRRGRAADYSPERTISRGYGSNPVLVDLPGGGVMAAWQREGLPTPSTVATLANGASRFGFGQSAYPGIPSVARAGDRVILATTVDGGDGRGGPTTGPVTARIGTVTNSRVSFGAPQTLGISTGGPVAGRLVAGSTAGQAVVAFGAVQVPGEGDNPYALRLQPQAAVLAAEATGFSAATALVPPLDADNSYYGALTPAAGRDGVARVAIGGLAKSGPCCSYEAPLLSVLAPGQSPATALAPGGMPVSSGSPEVHSVQSALVADDALALGATDGSWFISRPPGS